MRPVSILRLALLSAAAFLCSWDGATSTGLTLPSAVTVNVKIYRGTSYMQRKDWQSYIMNTFSKAETMMNNFTYGTTFNLKKVAWAEFNDSIELRDPVETISQSSTTPDINLHVFFAANVLLSLAGYIRNPGLLGKMCSIESKFRTLLINVYKLNKRSYAIHSDYTRSARVLVYYIGMLLGMERDTGDCTSGLMDYNNWDSGVNKQTWNTCNANNFYSLYVASPMYAREWRSTDACIDHEGKRYKDIPTELRLNMLVVVDTGFRRASARYIIDNLQHILWKQNSDGTYQLGIPIDVKPSWTSMSTPIDATSFTAANNQSYTFTQDKPHDLYVFFTKSGLLKPAHDHVDGKICSTDKHHRIIILDQKDWNIGGTKYKMSNDALARQLAYFIARLLEVRYDNDRTDSNSNACADGFMKYKDKRSYRGSDDDKLKKMLNYWNTEINTEWSTCNSEDLKYSTLYNRGCLKKARTATN